MRATARFKAALLALLLAIQLIPTAACAGPSFGTVTAAAAAGPGFGAGFGFTKHRLPKASVGVFSSPLRLDVNLPITSWFVYDPPLVDTAFSSPGVLAGEFGGFIGSTTGSTVPDANRDASGNVKSVPGGEASVQFIGQLPATTAQRKITWSCTAAAPCAATFTIANATGITYDLPNSNATYTPTNVLGAAASGPPTVNYTPVSTSDYPVAFQDRPVVDSGAVTSPEFNAVITADTSSNRIIRFMDYASVNRNNSPIHLTNSPGKVISAITFSGTTATVTTSTAHGLIGNGTGSASASVTVSGVTPSTYNVTDAYVNVVDATHFRYTMGGTPAGNASVVGSYTVGDANFQFTNLHFPSVGSEPGTQFNEPIYTSTNRNKNKADSEWHDGVPVETLASIAANAGANVWYNAPPNADSTFYTDVATVWATFSAANSRDVYVEVGNEPWNPSFTWNHQLIAEAIISGITADQRYAQKVVEVANYFRTAFASAGASSHLHIVAAWQAAGPTSVWSSMSTFLGTTDWAKITDLSVAGYYGNNADSSGAMYLAGFTPSYVGATAPLKAAINTDIDSVISSIVSHQVAAQALGKRLILYEGGNTVVLNDTTYKSAFERSSDAYDLELRFLQQLEFRVASQQAGGLDLAFYNLTYPLGANNFSWGQVEYLSQTLSKATTPKLQAHVDFKAGTRILSAATGSLGSVALPAVNGASLGALSPSVLGVTWALSNDDGGRLAINGTTGTVTVANASLLTVAGSRSVTVRQVYAGDPTGFFDTVASYNVAQTYRYYRLRTTATQATGGVAFAEFIGSTTPGGTNEFLGKTATATSIFGAPYTAAMAVDGDVSTFWNSDFSGTWPQDLVIDLGAGNAKAIAQFKIVARGGSQANQSPGDFTFAGSNDNITYTPLKTLTGQTYTSGEIKTFSVP